jgi:hypothetical protein
MTSNLRDVGAFVMVSLERAEETVSKIIEILEPLGIHVEVIGQGRRLRRTPSVVFRVPHHRVAETLLALELQGFPDVMAYQNVESPAKGDVRSPPGNPTAREEAGSPAQDAE